MLAAAAAVESIGPSVSAVVDRRESSSRSSEREEDLFVCAWTHKRTHIQRRTITNKPGMKRKEKKKRKDVRKRSVTGKQVELLSTLVLRLLVCLSVSLSSPILYLPFFRIQMRSSFKFVGERRVAGIVFFCSAGIKWVVNLGIVFRF